MMWSEFEELAGYRVTFEDYTNIIEPMYLAIPETVSKIDFIKMLDRKRFEYIPKKSLEEIERVNELKSQIESLKEDIKWYEGRIEDMKILLADETDENWIKEWKGNIKNYRERIKECRIQIKGIKWVLA